MAERRRNHSAAGDLFFNPNRMYVPKAVSITVIIKR